MAITDTDTDTDRKLGLSPKARRLVFPLIASTLVVIVIGSVFSQRTSPSPEARSSLETGSDVHSIADLSGRVFVGGHSSAGFLDSSGTWKQAAGLDEADVMGWARAGRTVLAGAHAGLFRSTDDGMTFAAARLSGPADVHGLGASGSRVYLASPTAGVLVSDNGGTSFSAADAEQTRLTGTIWVNPKNPDVALASSTAEGVVSTNDGGATWTALGSHGPASSIAVGDNGRLLVALEPGGAQWSTDSGATWMSLTVPPRAAAVAYTADDVLLSTVLVNSTARVYRLDGGAWSPYP